MRRAVLGLVALCAWAFVCAWAGTLAGCAGGFHDTYDHGVPNLREIAPGMWRSGHPPDAAAWDYLAGKLARPGQHVLVVQLHDDVEGDDSPVTTHAGWRLLKATMPPEDDMPWTVAVMPSHDAVVSTVDAIVDAYRAGDVVLWQCVHGRDRTSLIAALVGRALWGWSKDQGWSDMLAHGFRWELPDLDAYWLAYGARRR